MCYSASSSELVTDATPMANITSMVYFEHHGLSSGAVAGIVILVLVLVAGMAGAPQLYSPSHAAGVAHYTGKRHCNDLVTHERRLACLRGLGFRALPAAEQSNRDLERPRLGFDRNVKSNSQLALRALLLMRYAHRHCQVRPLMVGNPVQCHVAPVS